MPAIPCGQKKLHPCKMTLNKARNTPKVGSGGLPVVVVGLGSKFWCDWARLCWFSTIPGPFRAKNAKKLTGTPSAGGAQPPTCAGVHPPHHVVVSDQPHALVQSTWDLGGSNKSSIIRTSLLRFINTSRPLARGTGEKINA